MNEPDIDIEKLIALVEVRPVVWDKTLETYKHRNLTRDAWREICRQLDEDFDSRISAEKKQFGAQVIKKWTNIRDSWIKSWKKEKEFIKTGAKGHKPRKYVYHAQMSFLNKICSRPTYPSSDEETSNVSLTNSESQPKFAQQQIKNEDKLRGETRRKHQTAHKSSKILPQNKSVPRPEDSSVLPTLQNNSNIKGSKRKLDESESETVEVKSVEVESVDAHLNFFKGILPSLKDFTSDQTIDFQMGVLMLLKTIKSQSAVPTSHLSQRIIDIPVPLPFQIYTPQVSPYDYQQRPHSSSSQTYYQSSGPGTSHDPTEQSTPSYQHHQNPALRKISSLPIDECTSSNSNSRITILSPPSPTDSNLSSISEEIDIHFE